MLVVKDLQALQCEQAQGTIQTCNGNVVVLVIAAARVPCSALPSSIAADPVAAAAAAAATTAATHTGPSGPPTLRAIDQDVGEQEEDVTLFPAALPAHFREFPFRDQSPPARHEVESRADGGRVEPLLHAPDLQYLRALLQLGIGEVQQPVES
jgi:hypothetical protein